MKINICATVFFTVMVNSSVNAETVDVLSIDYPPFTAEADAENGPLFSILRQYASKYMPTKRIRAVFMPPARAARVLSMGQYCLSFYPPQEKLEEFEFIQLSDEKVKMGLIRKRQSGLFEWQDLAELKGKTVAILRPDKGGKLLTSITNAGLDVVYVGSITQGLKMLEKGRVDYAFGDNTTLPRLSQDAGIDEDSYQFSETSLQESVVGVNLRKSCKDDLFASSKQ